MSEHGPLAGYRALDLTDHRGALAGRLLADLGVDVVKVEPPGGEPGRRVPPFAGDRPGPTRSLSWLPGNFGKRSIELDLETDTGRARARRLAAASDFVLESFPPGHLAACGLGWDTLARAHPSVIVTSITAFGQTGPRAGWQPTDLTLMALGGLVMVCGERDRPPLRIGVPQAWYHAGAEAAVATLIAHHWRERTGQGQWVDAGAQGTIVRALMSESGFPVFHDGFSPVRDGPNAPFGGFRRRAVFPVKDGYVTFVLSGGPVGAASMRALVTWMAEEEELPPALRNKAWESWDHAGLRELGREGMQAELDDVEAAVSAFLARHTKERLYEDALRRRIMLAPLSEPRDLLDNAQLLARGFFTELSQPGLGRVRVPGPFARLSATPLAVSAAPEPGRHTEEALRTQPVPRRPEPETPAPAAPFAGLRVVDFTWAAAGPIATRYLFVTQEHPVIGPVPLEGHAFRLPACPPVWRPAPLWGEHNEYVFGEILGLGAEEMERLRREHVIW